MKTISRAQILLSLIVSGMLPLSISAQDNDADNQVEILAEKSVVDAEANKITFSGDVVVKIESQHITLECDKLEVFLAEEGSKVVNEKGQQSKFSRAVASGEKVKVQITMPGKKSRSATAEQIEYNAKTNDLVLSGGYPAMQYGKSKIRTDSKGSKIIIYGNGKFEVTGPGRHRISIPISSGNNTLSTGK